MLPQRAAAVCRRLSRGRIRMLTFTDVYIYALLGVILLQWVFKLLTGWRP